MDQKIDFSKIKELREDINELIKKHPELQAFQDKIDDALRKAGKNPENRLAALNSLVVEQKIKLLEALTELKKHLLILKGKDNE